MVLVALLVLSLVCLVIGLVLTNATWLIASLIATGGAAFLLWRTAPSLRSRPAAAGPAHAGKAPPPAPITPAPITPAPLVDAPLPEAPLTAPLPAAVPDAPAALPSPDWSLPTQAAAPLAAAAAPAVAAASAPVEPVAASVHVPTVPDVWVIDGRPRFHRVDCVQLVGQTAEPIPFAQAVEDGFIPCSLCAPSGR